MSAAGVSLVLPLRAERVRGGLLALLVIALLALPLALAGRPFELRVLTVMFLYAAMGQAWNLLAGYAGLVSVGQQAFVGLGGYLLFALTIHQIATARITPPVTSGA